MIQLIQIQGMILVSTEIWHLIRTKRKERYKSGCKT